MSSPGRHPETLGPGAAKGSSARRETELIVGQEVTAEEDSTLAWILHGIGHPCRFVYRCRAGAEALADEGQWFYRLFFADCSLAVRADGLRAYVASVSKLTSLPRLLGLIERTNLQHPAPLTSTQLREALMVGPPAWVPLCQGEAPVPDGAASYCLPGDPDTPVAREDLEAWSDALEELVEDGGLDEEQVRRTRGLAALPGEVIGHVGAAGGGRDGRDVFGRALPNRGIVGHPALGSHVKEEAGTLVATEYGYVYLRDGRLAIVSPIYPDEDNRSAYWLDLDRRPRAVTVQLAERWLQTLEITTGIDTSALEATVARIQDGGPDSSMSAVARASAPVDGDDSELEVIVDLEARRGALRTDGTIDLAACRRMDVKAGQEVARLYPPTEGIPGRNLLGELVAARDGRPVDVKAGAGVRRENGVRGLVHFYAECDGVLKCVPGEIAVTDSLFIDGDVGFETGNLSYAGEIVVGGSVGQGFSVKSASNVLVFGSVDHGATIEAGGDVVIGRGLAGRRTTVVCRGQLRAAYIYEARVRVGGDVLVGREVVQALLSAEGTVQVEAADGPGRIVGGEIWGLAGIRLPTAGSDQHPRTCLNAGIHTEDAKRLDLISRKLDESMRLINQHLRRFGMQHMDVKAILQRIAASTGPQKKVLARAARRLGQIVKQHQGLLQERRDIEEKAARGLAVAFVEADVMHPGVVVRIGDCRHEVTEPLERSRFRQSAGKLMFR